jgi:hypothetical protein
VAVVIAFAAVWPLLAVAGVAGRKLEKFLREALAEKKCHLCFESDPEQSAE